MDQSIKGAILNIGHALNAFTSGDTNKDYLEAQALQSIGEALIRIDQRLSELEKAK